MSSSLDLAKLELLIANQNVNEYTRVASLTLLVYEISCVHSVISCSRVLKTNVSVLSSVAITMEEEVNMLYQNHHRYGTE